MGKPKWPREQTDTLNACTDTQSVASDSQKPTDTSETVKLPQNGCKNTNLPGKTPKSCPRELQRPGNNTDAFGRCTHAQSG